MPILIALALVVIGFVWWAWGRHRLGAEVSTRMDSLLRSKPCRWADTGARNGRFSEHRCDPCGIAAYSTTGRAPETCKRNIKSKG